MIHKIERILTKRKIEEENDKGEQTTFFHDGENLVFISCAPNIIKF
jgi:hypothetical protein